MEEGFYIEYLVEKYDLKVLLSSQVDRNYIHNAIYYELAQFIIKHSTRAKFIEIINNLKRKELRE